MRGKQLVDSYVIGKVATYKRGFWQKELIIELQSQVLSRISVRCSIELEFYMHEYRLKENDIDNLCKVVLDSLKYAQVLRDDTYVDNLEATKIPIHIDDPEGVHITIWEWMSE